MTETKSGCSTSRDAGRGLAPVVALPKVTNDALFRGSDEATRSWYHHEPGSSLAALAGVVALGVAVALLVAVVLVVAVALVVLRVAVRHSWLGVSFQIRLSFIYLLSI